MISQKIIQLIVCKFYEIWVVKYLKHTLRVFHNSRPLSPDIAILRRLLFLISPLFMPDRQPVQLIPLLLPVWKEAIQDSGEPTIVTRLNQVR